MVHARLEFTIGSRTITAELTDNGWDAPESPSVAAALNRTCRIDQFGGCEGNPGQAAAHAAAYLYEGKVLFIHKSPPAPPGLSRC
jgi:hypothetical protein